MEERDRAMELGERLVWRKVGCGFWTSWVNSFGERLDKRKGGSLGQRLGW